jgi:uncharacterized protein (DUF4415 family)
MDTINLGAKGGQKIPEEVLAEIRDAAKYPINLEACPELSEEALKDFARLARERDKKKKRQSVTLRLYADSLEKYKALGKGYTSIMADVLKYAADNPKFLEQAVK